jgi:hypothetical protein
MSVADSDRGLAVCQLQTPSFGTARVDWLGDDKKLNRNRMAEDELARFLKRHARKSKGAGCDACAS